eukprot:Skav208937  [mRNA]  locus=scaffold875:91453:92342:+ [translate_table: standard]
MPGDEYHEVDSQWRAVRATSPSSSPGDLESLPSDAELLRDASSDARCQRVTDGPPAIFRTSAMGVGYPTV